MTRRIILTAALLCFAAALYARGYEETLRRNLWNIGENITGIREDTVSISTAKLYGSYETGGLRGPSDPASAWRIGAHAATIMHLPKFSMRGTFGFEQLIANSMCGSMFIHPGFYPVDVYEFTPGNKTGQTYSFSGGLSADIAPHWRIGALMEFESANLAKRKDLRHNNFRLDMLVSPSVQYHSGKFSFGLNYIFSRNTESVNAEQVGSSTSGYQAFFDKGLFYGVGQLWQGSGVHLSEAGVSGLPVKENINGAGVQLSYGGWFLNASYRFRSGEVGEKQFIWYRFPGHDANVDIGFISHSGECYHRVLGNFSFLQQNNTESVLEKTTVGGVTVVENYGFNPLSCRRRFAGSVEYEYYSPKCTARALVGTDNREMNVGSIYPWVAYQSLLTPFLEVYGKVALWKFNLSLCADYRRGLLTDTLLSVSNQCESLVVPSRQEEYFSRTAELVSRGVVSLEPAVRFNFLKGFYVQASARWQKAFRVQTIGGSRIAASILFGYDF